jgi:hypothetical protein
VTGGSFASVQCATYPPSFAILVIIKKVHTGKQSRQFIRLSAVKCGDAFLHNRTTTQTTSILSGHSIFRCSGGIWIGYRRRWLLKFETGGNSLRVKIETGLSVTIHSNTNISSQRNRHLSISFKQDWDENCARVERIVLRQSKTKSCHLIRKLPYNRKEYLIIR